MSKKQYILVVDDSDLEIPIVSLLDKIKKLTDADIKTLFRLERVTTLTFEQAIDKILINKDKVEERND